MVNLDSRQLSDFEVMSTATATTIIVATLKKCNTLFTGWPNLSRKDKLLIRIGKIFHLRCAVVFAWKIEPTAK